ATGYAKSENYIFSGASSSPLGNNPTVTNSSAVAKNFGLTTVLTFTNGVSTAGGLMSLYDAQTASISATDGSLTSNTISVTINPATAASLTLSAASGSITAGTTDQLTITAYDTYGNVATGYATSENYTFSGASSSPLGNNPTVTNNAAVAKNFGTTTVLTFTNGVSTAGGLMTLYDAQNASISATDGTLTSNTISIKVNPATAASL